MHDSRGFKCPALFAVLLVAGFVQVYGQMDEPLLDLNPLDNTTINTTSEYFDMDQVIFLSNMTEYITPNNGSWDSIIIALLDGERPIDEMVDVFTLEAFEAGRVDQDYRGLFSRTRLSDNALELIGYDIDASMVTSGMVVGVNELHNASNGSTVMNEFIIEVALNSAGYIVREHPGYEPRVICIIADDLITSTTACLTLYFIGYNDDQPVVTYEPNSNVTFTEGHNEYISIIDGQLNVTDQDHPTRYPMMLAEARIEGYVMGYPEFLGVSYQDAGFDYDYNMNTGVLRITGNASTDSYQQVLSNLTYFNNMSEPLGESRSISVAVFDGKFWSEAVNVLIIINNTNDVPAISLNGGDPVVQQFSSNYTEGTGAQPIVPNLQVVDTDPNAMIKRVTVNLTNPIDGMDEEISISGTGMGLTIAPRLSSHFIEITGIAATSTYTNVLRGLTYQHYDAAPGNPSTSEPRVLVFYVEDEENAANIQSSVLDLTIVPVNDPPILLFVTSTSQRANVEPVLTGDTQMSFTYFEDDPALNFGRHIYLRDVDSNISIAVLSLSNFLDGAQDYVYADAMLLDAYGVDMEISSDDNSSRMIVLNTASPDGISPMAFEEVLRSLSYINRYQDNRVTDGQRSITIVATDTSGSDSGSIVVEITAVDRNDGPVIDVGGGDSMDFVVTFIEEGDSVPIALSHLIDIMDEELHNISRLRVELISTNGQLDPSDSIFLRSPMSLPFLNHFVSPPNRTYIEISLNASISLYEQALRAIYFDNAELEPTIFNATGENVTLTNLTRVVVLSITDTNFAEPGVDVSDIANADLGTSTTTIRIGINIQPINDNRPRIRILGEPQGCATSSENLTDTEAGTVRRRRDLRAASRIRRRSVQDEDDKAPRIVSAIAHQTRVSNTSACLTNITLTFNVDTSVPIVEVTAKLSKLISFDVQDLNTARKSGRWMDYRTLSIVFEECVEWAAITTNGKVRPINIIFEAEIDDCDWSTPCSSGVCFANNTGCPITGTYLLKYNQTDVMQEADTDDGDVFEYNYQASGKHYFVTLVFVLAGICFGVLTGCIVLRRRRSGVRSSVKTGQFHKMISIEDAEITVSEAEPEESQSNSHVQDLNTQTPLSADPAKTDHKTIKTFSPVSHTHKPPHHLKPPEATTVGTNEPLKSPKLAGIETTMQPDAQVVQAMDSLSPLLKATLDDGKCGNARLTEISKVEQRKEQSLGKRRKRRAKTPSPPKVNNEDSIKLSEKLELKSPLSDDICNWLQLDTRESKTGDQRLPMSCDMSHDVQPNAQTKDSDSHAHRTVVERLHHRNSTNRKTEGENRLVETNHILQPALPQPPSSDTLNKTST